MQQLLNAFTEIIIFLYNLHTILDKYLQLRANLSIPKTCNNEPSRYINNIIKGVLRNPPKVKRSL